MSVVRLPLLGDRLAASVRCSRPIVLCLFSPGSMFATVAGSDPLPVEVRIKAGPDKFKSANGCLFFPDSMFANTIPSFDGDSLFEQAKVSITFWGLGLSSKGKNKSSHGFINTSEDARVENDFPPFDQRGALLLQQKGLDATSWWIDQNNGDPDLPSPVVRIPARYGIRIAGM